MGAYLSKPKTEMNSVTESNSKMSYGASAMQGWRVSMEDAHTCLLDFDEDTSLFAVYDGHGGQEVAEYVSKHLPDVLRGDIGYKEGNTKQALIDTFLKVDESIVSEEGLKELKEIAGDNDDSGDENEADLLTKDANIPLSELLAKLKEVHGLQERANENEEDSGEDSEEEEENGHLMNGDSKTEEKKNANGKMGQKERHSEDEEEKENKDASKSADKDDDKGVDEKGVDEEGASEEPQDGEEEEEEEEESEEEEEEEEDEDGEGVLVKSDEAGYDSGTTAIVALVKDNNLTVANVGDSRCVLCRNGIALDMSIDHKPEDEKELNRIHKAGGKVTCEGRVNGGLNLSRALGDHSYKGQSELGAHEQQITAMPDIRQTTLTEADEFMVIACDGIWNVKNSQEVVDFVKQEMKNGEENLSSICEKLFDACLAPDTSGDGAGCDNMTCVIVSFKPEMTSSTKPGKRKADEETNKQADKKSRTDSD
ncbi:probable protein phosphatase 2C 3 isoform X2 [Nematostella vectensis]|uniref:probable protein phosphatase 2C 3 isoform X2 n=1 Tax=Nematostella vectensis TaxID=45351 RepID=UPI0020773F97|nr:probable protein phosphatase 2C 3 isoform X2 [Nematostella vectensis]